MTQTCRHVIATAMAIAFLGGAERTSRVGPKAETRPGTPKSDDELIQRVKSAAFDQLSPGRVVELVGDLPTYDSDGRPSGVQVFDRHDCLEGPDSTIAMSAIGKEGRRVLFWNRPIPPSNTDTSLKCVGIVWKKDGTVAYFSGEYWIPSHG